MAYSSSIVRAQTVKLCELCQEDNIKWRCVDCEMCLCEKCKIRHPRLPVTAKHQIVTIETPIQDIQRKIVTDGILCKNHVANLTCMSCKTCDCLVCPECVSTSHPNHLFMSIEKALNDKLKILRETQTNVDDKLQVCASKTENIQNVVHQMDSICDDSVAKIKQREQELMNAIIEYSNTLQDNVRTKRAMAKTIVSKVGQQVDDTRKKLEDFKNKLEAALTSSQGQVIFDTSCTEPVMNFDSLPDKVQIFIPEKETTPSILELFGSLQDMVIQVTPELNIFSVRFEVLRTITTDLPYTSKVIPLDEATAWISCNKNRYTELIIRKITTQGTNIVTTNEITLDIHDMALTPNNDILVAEYNCSDVKLITKSMETKLYLTVTPLHTSGIYVTNDNQVLVGVIESGAGYTPMVQSQRAVVLFDQYGKRKSMYEFDRNRKRLFDIPERITTNSNQDIVVVDRISTQTGRVVTLDGEGNLKWIYEGHPKINQAKKFDPKGIAITSANYIIVSDRVNHALHVLSENGNILAYKYMDDMGVMYPWALNIDKLGKLWLGCSAGGKYKRAPIHIIKMSL